MLLQIEERKIEVMFGKRLARGVAIPRRDDGVTGLGQNAGNGN